MPRTKSPENIQALLAEFAARMDAAVEARVQERIQALMGQAFSKTGTAIARKPASPGRVLQGQYIGRLRKLKGAERVRIQKLARTKGVAEAIKAMERLAG